MISFNERILTKLELVKQKLKRTLTLVVVFDWWVYNHLYRKLAPHGDLTKPQQLVEVMKTVVEVPGANTNWKLEIVELRLVLVVGDKSVKKFECQLCEIFGEICKALRISDKNLPSVKTK